MAETEQVWVRVSIFGGPDDGAVRQVKQERLHEFEPVVLYDEARRAINSSDVYVVRWQLADASKPDSLEGRWVAVFADLIMDEIAEYARNRDPEAHADDEARGVKLCEHGKHQWSEWTPTPQGNRVRQCNVCFLGQGSVV